MQPDDGGKEEKKPKKQGFLAKLSKLLFGDDEPDEEEISGMQAEPAVTEMSMDDMDILKELEGSSDDDKKGKKEKKKKEKKKLNDEKFESRIVQNPKIGFWEKLLDKMKR